MLLREVENASLIGIVKYAALRCGEGKMSRHPCKPCHYSHLFTPSIACASSFALSFCSSSMSLSTISSLILP
jgi:hypothetical protein